MKKVFLLLFMGIFVILSCEKEKSLDQDLETSFSTDFKTTGVNVILGTPQYPNIESEVQIDINQTLSYPVYIHLKLKSSLTATTLLISDYYVIPAGQSYVVCDIPDYTNITSLYLQICDIEFSGNETFNVDKTIMNINYPEGLASYYDVTYSYPQLGGFVSLSNFSCTGISFYIVEDDDNGGGGDPIRPPLLR